MDKSSHTQKYWLLYLFALFNDNASSSGYNTQNDRMTNELEMIWNAVVMA
jgi:hypothetical protein